MVNDINWNNLKSIITYHAIHDLESFEEQLKFLASKKNVLITFDDGDRTVYEKAFPLLLKYKLPSIVFVITELIDSNRPFWWDEVLYYLGPEVGTTEVRQMKNVPNKERISKLELLRRQSEKPPLRNYQLTRTELHEMHEAGVIIANHSHTHPMFDQLSKEEMISELSESQKFFEKLGFGQFNWFAYPNGNFSELAESTLREFDVDKAFLFDHQLNKGNHPLRTSRLSVNDYTPLRKIQMDIEWLAFKTGTRNKDHSPDTLMKKTYKDRLAGRFRGKPWLHGLMDFSGRELNPEQWVFIIGCYNSGTTLLQEMLSLNSAIGTLNDEGVMLTNLLPRPEDHGWRRMWSACEAEMQMEEVNQPLMATQIKRHWSNFYPNRKILLEKSISNTARIPFFKNYFKPAKFIHIVRNGYAVVEGIARKAEVMPAQKSKYADRYPLELCANQWVRTMEVVNQEMDQSFLEVSYEDLTENPEKTLNLIYDFIGIGASDENIVGRQFKIHGESSQIINMNSKAINALTQQDKETIDAVAASWLKKYGYI